MADRKRLVVLGLAIALAVVGARTADIAFAVIAVSILYGLWSVVLRLIVPRSRYLGGIAVSILSVLPLAVGFIAESLSIVLGVTIGALMGYFAGWVDLLGLRLVEIFNAIPRLFLILAFVAAFPQRNIYLIMVIVGLTGWPGYAYFVRAEFLRLRNTDYVQAAIATSAPLGAILFRHMLPNGMAPVLVQAGFGVAEAILYESVLSFLGVGLVEMESWGKLLSDALGVGGAFYWWIALYPGLAIFLTVFAYVLVGEGMRDALDPKTAEEG